MNQKSKFKKIRIALIITASFYSFFFLVFFLQILMFSFLTEMGQSDPATPIILKYVPFVIVVSLGYLFYAIRLNRIKKKVPILIAITVLLVGWIVLYGFALVSASFIDNIDMTEKIAMLVGIVFSLAVLLVPQIIYLSKIRKLEK